MKKFFNHATMLIVATLFTFNACLLTDPYIPYVPIENGEEVSIFLRIDEAEFQTRHASSQAWLVGPTDFQFGHLFLTTPTGVIIEHFTISNAPASALNINRTALFSTGVVIENVPVSVRNGRVVLVGNTAITGNPTHIDQVKATVIDVRHQHAFALAGDPNPQLANLFGSANLRFSHMNGEIRVYRPIIGSTPAPPHTFAPVRLRPTTAHLVFRNLVGAGNVQSFTIEGVFIDRYYRHAHVGGTLVPTSFRDNLAAGRAFDYNSSGYPTAFHGYTWDWHAAGLPSTPTSITIGSTNLGTLPMANPGQGAGGAAIRWFYNLFAYENTTAPRIVFRLRDVQVAGEPQPRPTQFVVFDNFVWCQFNTNHPEGTPFPGISAGNIYSIAENRLLFYEGDLRATPSTLSTLSTRAVPIMIEE